MTKQNIKRDNIVVTYGDGNNNTIAVCIKMLSKDGTIKYELYKTDSNLSNFEYLTSSNNPYDFDKVLYKNTKPKTVDKVSPVLKDTNSSKTTSIKSVSTSRQSKKLF